MVKNKRWLVMAAFLAAAGANGGVLLDRPYGSPDTILTDTDPTMNVRIARDGTPSDWSYMKFFPGYFGGPGARAYDLWTFNNNWGIDLYVQISLDDLADTFLLFSSAYMNSFDALDQEVNYLGDAGLSPTLFGAPVTYQVIVPAGNNLVVVVNQTSIGPGDLPLEYGLVVEAYSSPFYDALPVPEPSSLALCFVGLAAVAARRLMSVYFRKG